MELIEVKSLIWAQKGKLYIIYEKVMWILATTSLDFTPPFPHFTHTSVEGKLINLCMSYRLEMKFFLILKLLANRSFRLLLIK
jgi:hypothetical protein